MIRPAPRSKLAVARGSECGHEGGLIFRCDATINGGSGHVMRCLALAAAAAARGVQVRFMCQPETLVVAPALVQSGAAVSAVAEDGSGDAVSVLSATANKNDVMLVDSYEIGSEFEALCRAFVRGFLRLTISPTGPARAIGY